MSSIQESLLQAVPSDVPKLDTSTTALHTLLDRSSRPRPHCLHSPVPDVPIPAAQVQPHTRPLER